MNIRYNLPPLLHGWKLYFGFFMTPPVDSLVKYLPMKMDTDIEPAQIYNTMAVGQAFCVGFERYAICGAVSHRLLGCGKCKYIRHWLQRNKHRSAVSADKSPWGHVKPIRKAGNEHWGRTKKRTRPKLVKVGPAKNKRKLFRPSRGGGSAPLLGSIITFGEAVEKIDFLFRRCCAICTIAMAMQFKFKCA